MTMTDAAAPRGLKGVIVADTALGDVRGLEGFYHYRQYSAPELAAKRTFEDVWYLLFEGDLPSLARRDEYTARIAAARHLPAAVRRPAPGDGRPGTPHPLAALRTALSHLAAVEAMPPTYDADPETIRTDALRLCAVTPVLVAALYRASIGASADRRPRDDLGSAANYLYMIDGEVPEPARARAIEQYLILAIDHGFNASTFTARVRDVDRCRRGRRGRRRARRALGTAARRRAESRARHARRDRHAREHRGMGTRAVAGGERIMGFGHAVYRTADPRSVMLRDIARSLGGPRVDFAVQVEATVERVPRRAQARPRAAHQRRVLRRRGDGAVRHPAGAVHADVRGQPHRRLVRAHPRAVDRDRHHPPERARYVGPEPPQPVPLAS